MRELAHTAPKLAPWELLRRVGAMASRSPYTVRRYVLGLPVTSTTRDAIEDALRGVGRVDLIRTA